jgi:hypothetical protein
LPTDDYLWARRDLDVAQPVGVAAKGTHNDDLGTRFPVFHHLEDGFAAPPGATPDVGQKQKAAAEKATAPPVVQVNWNPKDQPKWPVHAGLLRIKGYFRLVHLAPQ